MGKLLPLPWPRVVVSEMQLQVWGPRGRSLNRAAPTGWYFLNLAVCMVESTAFTTLKRDAEEPNASGIL